MRGLVRLFVVLALVAPVTTLQAAEKKAPAKKKAVVDQISGQGYNVAGCGLGSVLFGTKPGMIQILAATVNGISGNQTFGITSGTLNCDIPEMGQQAAVFIELNGETVRKDFARGRGETVSSLAYILKCQDSNLFGDTMRTNLESIFQDGISTYESTRRILKTIDSNPDLKNTCAIVG